MSALLRTDMLSSQHNPPVQSNEEKTSSKCVRKGLVEFSTIKRGSTTSRLSRVRAPSPAPIGEPSL